MGRRYRRRRQSDAAALVTDVAYIGNRLPWWGAALFGVLLWFLFAKVFPQLATLYLEGNLSNSPYKAALIQAFGRRLHWLEYIGVALGLICAFFAVRNYFTDAMLEQRDERQVGASVE